MALPTPICSTILLDYTQIPAKHLAPVRDQLTLLERLAGQL
jgi:hypothetical protein